MDWSGDQFMCSQEYYYGVYFPGCEAMREINKNNTQVSV